jgi:serine/threonine protein kinase
MGNINTGTNFSKHYISGKKIAVGTFATVKKCVRKSDNKQFAVKIVKKSALTHKERSLLTDEIKILSMINHPNIISIEDVFESDKKVKIVLELCSSKNLMDKINTSPDRRLDESECAKITFDIAKSLKHLHSKLVIHRDLKPENVLFQNGILKLTDFGSASAAYKKKKYLNNIANVSMKTMIGTPFYVAPEVVIGNGYGNQVDLWSLGVIIYQMLCGYHPFDTNKGINYLYQQIKQCNLKFDNNLWKDVSNDAKDLVTKLLVKDPKKRITADQLLKHPWILNHVQNNVTV